MKFKRKRHFSEKSIREQMKEIVAVTILLFLLLCMLINESTKQLIFSNAEEYMLMNTIRLRNQIELVYQKMENFCISIQKEKSVQELMDSDYHQLALNINDASARLTGYKVLEPAIEDISLVNETVHYSTVYSYEEMDDIRDETRGSVFQWIGIKEHNFIGAEDKSDMMVYAGDIMLEERNLGTIIISLNFNYQLENENEMNSSYLLVDPEGSIHPFNCTTEAAEEIHRKWKANSKEGKMKDEDYAVHAFYFEEMNCYLLGALDLKGSGTGLSRIQLLIWGCVILAVIFCIMFFFFVNRGVMEPLYQFNEAIRQIRELRQRRMKGKLDLKGCAEITEIGKEFTGMLQDIETMNHQIFQSATDLYEMKVQKQEAELAYLRSQIDPHFLYNTLEVVRKMALEKNAPEIAQMSVDMGNIFRYGTKGSYIVPLEKEISIIKSYIRIQQLRFDGKIEVFYFIEEDVLSLTVIKMLLQPIVENAVFHGLEPKSDKGNLYIGARCEGKNLIITITDDGVGIPQKKLEEIQRDLKSEHVDTSKHVGILNTNARIRLQYGIEYGMRLDSCVGDGTTVTMILPVQEIEKEKE